MAATTVIAGGTLAAGTHSYGPVTIPDVIVGCSLQAETSQHTSPAVSFQLSIEISLDGGVTWQPLVSVGRIGQATPPIDPSTGLPATTAGFTCGLPAGTGRRARGSLVISGGSLTTQGVTITTF